MNDRVETLKAKLKKHNTAIRKPKVYQIGCNIVSRDFIMGGSGMTYVLPYWQEIIKILK